MPSMAPMRTKSRPSAGCAPPGMQRELLERVHYRRGVAHDGLPWDDPTEHDGNSAVKHGAGDKGSEDAEGQIALRLLALFGGGRDRIEANVGEEDDRSAGRACRSSRWA